MSRLFAISLLALAWAFGVAAAGPPVQLDVYWGAGLPPDDLPRIHKSLSEIGFSSVRLASGAERNPPKIEERGAGAAKSFVVVGHLVDGGMLIVPGGRFRVSDKAGLKNWIAKLADGGEAGVTEKPQMFGLSAENLKSLHAILKAPVAETTKGRPSNEVLRELTGATGLKVVVEGEAKSAVKSADAVLDEFQGLATGTAMAAVLRPLGLVLIPERPLGGKLQLKIVESKTAGDAEVWRVGWKGSATPGELAPALFKTTAVQVDDRPIAEVIDAIATRAELPVLYDHNSLARRRIDPAIVKVTVERRNQSYHSALSKALSSAKMKYELRADEAEKPFLWVTSSLP